MTRKLFAAAAVAFLIGVCGFWLASYDRFVYSMDGRVLVLRGDTAAIEGALAFADSRPTEVARPGVRESMRDPHFWYKVRADGKESAAWSWHGFESHDGTFVGSPYRLLAVPYYALAGPAAVIAAVAVFPLLRPRRRRGTCRKCGYDLRATPDGNGRLLSRCPECGEAPASAAAEAA